MSPTATQSQTAFARKSQAKDDGVIEGLTMGTGLDTPSSGSSVYSSKFKNVKIKQNELIMFTTQLAVMLESGVVLSDALEAIGAQLTRCWDVFREGGVIIAPSICDGWFNEHWFPSYEPTYEKMQKYSDFSKFCQSDFVEEIATHPDYTFQYRNRYTYHPYHAFSMITCGTIALQRTTAVFIPGARNPGYARGMSCIPTDTFEEAMERAKKIVGKNPRILCTPEAFSGGVGVHLHKK